MRPALLTQVPVSPGTVCQASGWGYQNYVSISVVIKQDALINVRF